MSKLKKYNDQGIAFETHEGLDLYKQASFLPPFIYSKSMWKKFGYSVPDDAPRFANVKGADGDYYPVYEFGVIKVSSSHPSAKVRRRAFLEFKQAYTEDNLRALYQMAFSTSRFRLTRWVWQAITKKLPPQQARHIKIKYDLLFNLFDFHAKGIYQKTPRYLIEYPNRRKIVPGFSGWVNSKRLQKWQSKKAAWERTK